MFLILAIALQIIDIASTVIAIRRGGVERNPIVARAIARWGLIPGLLVGKAPPAVALTVAALGWVPEAHWIIWGACAFFAAVIVNNLIVIRGQK